MIRGDSCDPWFLLPPVRVDGTGALRPTLRACPWLVLHPGYGVEQAVGGRGVLEGFHGVAGPALAEAADRRRVAEHLLERRPRLDDHQPAAGAGAVDECAAAGE